LRLSVALLAALIVSAPAAMIQWTDVLRSPAASWPRQRVDVVIADPSATRADRTRARWLIYDTVMRYYDGEPGRLVVLGGNGRVLLRAERHSTHATVSRRELSRVWLSTRWLDLRVDLPAALRAAATESRRDGAEPGVVWIAADALPVTRLRASDLSRSRVDVVSWALAQERAAGRVPDLRGVEVIVLEPRADAATPRERAAAREVWSRWAAASGARMQFRAL
jgi:hypothetical protein